jgi:hypothetical protein
LANWHSKPGKPIRFVSRVGLLARNTPVCIDNGSSGAQTGASGSRIKSALRAKQNAQQTDWENRIKKYNSMI